MSTMFETSLAFNFTKWHVHFTSLARRATWLGERKRQRSVALLRRATMNFTTEEKSQTLAEQLCFPATEASNETSHENMARVCLSVFTIIFSITAVLGNILILIAFHKESSLHPPSKLLFRCLAATDLCCGVVTQPTFVIYQLSIVTKSSHICYLAASLSYISTTVLCGISAATLTAISVDRLLALQLKMRYRSVVTLKRVRLAVVFLWLQNITVNMLVFKNRLAYFSLSCFVMSLNVVVSTVCYLKIFFTLRLQSTQVQDLQSDQGQPSGSSSQIGTRYKKTVSSALVFQLVLIACYVPYIVVRGMVAIAGRRLLVSEAVVASLVYLNSSLNPLFYCWKIKEIRQEVKQMVRQTFYPQRWKSRLHLWGPWG